MLANQRAIGPLPRPAKDNVGQHAPVREQQKNHLLERVCSQFMYEKFPGTTQSTCKLVDAVQQRHNISRVGCALIQVNVCVVEILGDLLSTLQVQR